MAGLYLHVPFCNSRCIYCDFYSTVHGEQASRYVDCLVEEMKMRSSALDGPLHTIYIGGGTPSLLSPQLVERLLVAAEECFGIAPGAEVTLEGNPDDLTFPYLASLREAGVNRLSIGVQSFHDRTLCFLRRRHTARQAVEAVENARRAGFGNLSLDLIYGLPGEELPDWRENIDRALELKPEHLSAYLLTYETGTPLEVLRRQGKVTEAGEDLALACYGLLTEMLRAAGYEHYEISNFARPGFVSRHNSSYWRDVPYLGCGPSAHSYYGGRRRWNAPALFPYMEALGRGELPPGTCEEPERFTAYNDFVITRLRTSWGFSLAEVEARFGREACDFLLRAAAPWLASGHLLRDAEGRFCLSESGMFVSNAVMEDFIRVD
ncbi:MAG: radical SAM family heme chaperone HemW [Bacteroidaceae bacterium]|jgi:putative oxygen-independent coproporphyrinogen III oxidase